MDPTYKCPCGRGMAVGGHDCNKCLKDKLVKAGANSDTVEAYLYVLKRARKLEHEIVNMC